MKEINGKEISAKLVIQLAIKYLRDHLLQLFKERNIGIKPDDIEWVLTVPAIWNDACKQFMRDAAIGVCERSCICVLGVSILPLSTI
jgi:hypothetical protein